MTTANLAMGEEAQEHERRATQRLTAQVLAGLKFCGRPAEAVSISDISIAGCRFRTRSNVQVGSKGRLLLPGLESWWATVSWFEDGDGGLQFDRPLHPLVAQRFASAS